MSLVKVERHGKHILRFESRTFYPYFYAERHILHFESRTFYPHFYAERRILHFESCTFYPHFYAERHILHFESRTFYPHFYAVRHILHFESRTFYPHFYVERHILHFESRTFYPHFQHETDFGPGDLQKPWETRLSFEPCTCWKSQEAFWVPHISKATRNIFTQFRVTKFAPPPLPRAPLPCPPSLSHITVKTVGKQFYTVWATPRLKVTWDTFRVT